MEDYSQNRINANNALKPVKTPLDLDTRNKIHKHLLDINDIITDEDIRRIKIDVPTNVPSPKHSRNKRRK